ncbi:hypothetical protein [Aeromonas phage Akh-2]|nr:hypothetical protein [Aeromonas phage Akh-2]
MPESLEPFDKDFRNISANTYKKLGAFTHSNWLGRLCFPIVDNVTGNTCAVL